MKLRFDNTYATLPDRFYARLNPVPVASPSIVRVNTALAEQLGFDADWLASDAGAAFATGNHILDGADPIATVYGGHQFGNWAGRLGDGRAILLGEVLDRDGERFDVQLKGSGRTPFSRGGDGRAPLGPVLREYIVSEAMSALGIPTSRALVAATTGEKVRRETLMPGGVLVRVAKSHIRIGTFEYFASQGDADAIHRLVDYVIARHYPEIEVVRDEDGAVSEKTVLTLLRAVAEREAELVAKWQLVGFIHGVMNTDNMLLSGETIDYGPCAFMDEYDSATVYSSIDRQGRYAYGNQPRIAQWNVSRLAVAILGAIDASDAAWTDAQSIIDRFPKPFRVAYAAGMSQKLGLQEVRDEDWELYEDLLEVMAETDADYTLTFVRLTELVATDESENSDARRPALAELGALPETFDAWIQRWRARMDDESAIPARQRVEMMRAANPIFIPRNHRVNAAIEAAVSRDDFSPFHKLVDILAHPFEVQEENLDFAQPPAPDERIEATFCGT